MKKRLLLLFAALLALGQTAFANAFFYTYQGQTLYYNITSSSQHQVEVIHWTNDITGDVVIPNIVTESGITYTVTSIGQQAFYSCYAMTSVAIPNSVTSIGQLAFYGCHRLTSVNIPNLVTSIDYRTFYNCVDLTSVIIPSSVTTIGEEAFNGCRSLTSVYIPNSVTSIGNKAFYLCTGLTTVTIGNSVATIGNEAFSNCRSLIYVNIPNSVTSIGYSAFIGCDSLTSVTIGNSVTSIGHSTFGYCSSLTSIVVDAGNTHYDSRDNCNAIIQTDLNLLRTGCSNTVIPNTVTSIDDRAFSGCSNLISVTIPNSVTSIGQQAFCGCSNLISVTIPNSITSISDSTFSYCSGLTSMTIGNSVTSIGQSAFMSCSSLTSVIIPNSVTTIGKEAFQYCSGLTSVTIPSSVTSIGNYAFNNCTQIMNIYMLGTNPPVVQPNSFRNVPSIANLHVPCDAVSTYQNASAVWNQFNIVEEFPYSFSAITGDQARGVVEVIHAPECNNREAEIQATPYHNFHFIRWSDGNTEAHRYVVVMQDTALQAEFGDGGVRIEDVADGSDINISVTNGRIHVNIDGKPIEEFDVYNVMGCRVAHVIHSGYSQILQMGVYLIKIGNLPARKVVVVR